MKNNFLHKKIKELSPQESLQMVKDLLKRKRSIVGKELKPGHLFFAVYDAKDKTQTYDRTPFVLILRRNASHTLGLNFHWVPLSMRINLIMIIMKLNAYNIRERKSLNFDYKQLRPMLKSLGYAPCIRMYINSRFSPTGVVIPSHQMMEMARLRTETFTSGKFSAQQLFAIARKRAKASAKKIN